MTSKKLKLFILISLALVFGDNLSTMKRLLGSDWLKDRIKLVYTAFAGDITMALVEDGVLLGPSSLIWEIPVQKRARK